MSQLDPLDPRLTEIERRLADLSPRDARLNVAETVFQAGRESALRQQRRGRIVWPLVTVASALLAVVSTAALVRRPQERIVYVEKPAVATTEGTSDESVERTRREHQGEQTGGPRGWATTKRPISGPELGYLRIRQLVLEFGVESLPTMTTVVSNGNPPPLRYGDAWQGFGSNESPSAESGSNALKRSIEPFSESRGGSS